MDSVYVIHFFKKIFSNFLFYWDRFLFLYCVEKSKYLTSMLNLQNIYIYIYYTLMIHINIVQQRTAKIAVQSLILLLPSLTAFGCILVSVGLWWTKWYWDIFVLSSSLFCPMDHYNDTGHVSTNVSLQLNVWYLGKYI